MIVSDVDIKFTGASWLEIWLKTSIWSNRRDLELEQKRRISFV